MENPIKMDDLGVPLFLETPIYLVVMFAVTPDEVDDGSMKSLIGRGRVCLDDFGAPGFGVCLISWLV